MERRIVVFFALLAGGVLAPPAHAQDLRRCGGAMCGSIERPLNPAQPNGRQIDIAFRLYRARDESEPPIVAVEGGPGYPSTGTRAEYRAIFGPLLRTRSLLLVDNRGSGGSALIDSVRVLSFAGRTSGSSFARRAGECAREIEREHGAGASGLFATAYAVDDLAAVLEELEIEEFDLYGDSYGTFFVQDFIARHPDGLRSVILDSAYPRRDLDPWYVSSGAAARAALETVSPGSVARLGELLTQVREEPIRGRTRDADGSALRVRVGPRELVDLVQDSASDPVILRELDASVRAALAGDDVPLLRLTGQAGTWSHTPTEAGYFSRGAYLAVSCVDYPQLFKLTASPDERREQLTAQVAPNAFAPFTAREWVSVSGFTQPYDVCLDWPRPMRRPPAVPDEKVDVPILIIGGDLDSLTPLADAPLFGPRLGDNVRIVNVQNTVHVSSQGLDFLTAGARCLRTIIRAFVAAPDAAPDTTCADAVPPLHTPHGYPAIMADVPPALHVGGPDPGEDARRAAVVAAETFADAVIRRYYSGANRGPGLRGGAFSVRGSRFTLRDVEFVADVPVDGSGTWSAATGAADATLTVEGVRVRVRWAQANPVATATIGASVLWLPAP
jgi:pimeloyl-ACP methyl ester carboxylesterase